MDRIAKIVAAILIAVSTMFFAARQAAPANAATLRTYLVLYREESVSSDAATVIAQAGGTLIYRYDQIGVAVARSDNPSFRANLLKDSRIENAAATDGFAYQLNEQVELADTTALGGPWGDPLSTRQWDMLQIHVPEAQAVTTGSSSVVVGDIDTGLDYTHPDLAANVDFSNSVSCLGGVPVQDPPAWMDDHGHGTHTAGTIAAAKNGIGIVGVAPNVKIAGIKTGNAAGFFYPEAVVCAFMWAGDHKLAVTNNSYFADPWLFNCRNDVVQRAIWKAEQRAIRYAMSQGVTVVAAAGNENKDLSKQNVDTISPDNGTPLTRDVTNACVVIPVEIPGVIGVSGDGSKLQKTYYSSYGVGAVQVVAPGGDRPFQPTTDASAGRVLSTWPGNRYFYASGTSMASPHVAGVAALVISQFGRLPQGQVQALINQTADPLPCPPNPFNPGGTVAWLATCVGGNGDNGFYGHGQVNALGAVTHKP